MTTKRVVPENSAYFVELAARHMKAFNGHISLYALNTATRLLKKAGCGFEVLGWPRNAVDEQYRQAYVVLAERLVMNGRRYGLKADGPAKMVGYMAKGKVTWAALGSDEDEIQNLIKKRGGK